MKYFGVVLLTVLCSALGKKLPSSFLLCKRKDPMLNECFSKATEKALQILKEPIPELSLPSMNPMKITKIEIPSSDSGSFRLSQKVTDVEVHNLINSEISGSDLTLGDEEYHLKTKLFNTLVNITGNYDVDGQVMLVEIKGQGPFVIVLENVNGFLDVSGKLIDKKGQKYLTVENTTFEVDPQHATVKFDNLFNGNQELTKSVNDMFNQNWKRLYSELSPSYNEAIGLYLQETIRHIFAKVSFDNLFPQ